VLRDCGDTQKGHTSYVCRCSRDVAGVDDLPSGPLDVTVGSHCGSVEGFSILNVLRPMLLRLDAPDPTRDRIVMPLDEFHWPRRCDASLRASDGNAAQSRRVADAPACPPGDAPCQRRGSPLPARARPADGDGAARRRRLCAHLPCDGVADALDVRIG
jgi:hypothetical protein